MKVESVLQTLEDICSDKRLPGIDDPNGLVGVNEGRKSAFQNCPMWKDSKRITQIVGIAEGEAIGRINVFPLEIVADGKIYSAVCGDSLFVREKYRSTLYAMSLMTQLNNVTKDKLSLSSGFSPKARKVIDILKNVNFKLRKFIVIRNSRCILPVVGRKRFLSKFSWILNVLIYPYRMLFWKLATIHLKGYDYVEFRGDDEEAILKFAEMIAMDHHRFRENMSESVLKWILNEDFIQERLLGKRIVAYKSGAKYIAFAMIREGFDRSGNKLGKVIEWQVIEDEYPIAKYLLFDLMNRRLKQLDVISIEFNPTESIDFGWLSGFIPAKGESMVSVGFGKGSPLKGYEGISSISNWRLRGGMGDVCFW